MRREIRIDKRVESLRGFLTTANQLSGSFYRCRSCNCISIQGYIPSRYWTAAQVLKVYH